MVKTKTNCKKLKVIIKKYGEKVIVKFLDLLTEITILNLLSQTYFKDLHNQSSNINKSSIIEIAASVYSLKNVLVDGILKAISFLSETLVSKNFIDFII